MTTYVSLLSVITSACMTMCRWRLVVHGCIDGYSRMITYLHCSSNNRSETVLTLFKEATQELGLPSRIRCDMGVENRAVSMYMLSHPLRGPNRNSVLVGRSVHNQRIERLWRDVYSGVLSLFYDLFMHMELEGVLDPINECIVFILCSYHVLIMHLVSGPEPGICMECVQNMVCHQCNCG